MSIHIIYVSSVCDWMAGNISVGIWLVYDCGRQYINTYVHVAANSLEDFPPARDFKHVEWLLF